jgi:hypothetical protein
MSEQATATIILFPRPKPAAEQGDPAARLQRALVALDLAVAEQRAAVAKWRASLADLRISVQRLGQTMGDYNARLGTLADGVIGLNRQAGQMEAWANTVLQGEAQP